MFSKSSGVNFKMENNTFSVDSHNGFDASSGFKTKIAMERVFKTNLPKPYSSCDFRNDEMPKVANNELTDLIYHSKYDYEQQLCISEKHFSIRALIFKISHKRPSLKSNFI